MPEALIWGASGGIGSALVRKLKGQGWKVYAAARNEAKIPAQADLRVEFDAADDYSIKQAAYAVAQESTALDLVVYAAGAMHGATLEQITPDAWQQVFDANLTGVQRAAAASLPLLREGGALMAIGAYVDKLTFPKFGAYAAAKAALEPLMTVMGKEHRKIKFTVVRPGAVDTPFWQNVPLNLPKTAISAEAIADAIAAHYESGGSGTLDL